LKLIREIDQVPSKYFKKLVKTNDIWEARVDVGRNTFRLLGFFNGHDLIILTNSFQKKSQKTPLNLYFALGKLNFRIYTTHRQKST
jgi:phage-related protein